MPLSFILLLLFVSSRQNPSVHAVNERPQLAVDNAQRDRIVRQASAASNKDFNGGVYWLSTDGPDFQMWPAMGSAYGSGQMGGIQMSNLGNNAQQQGSGGNQGSGGQQIGQQQQPQQQQSVNGQSQHSQMTSPPLNLASQQQQQAFAAATSQQLLSQIQQNSGTIGTFPGYNNGQFGAQQQNGMMGATGGGISPYSGYLEKQINNYPVMIYTLSDCIPCQRAKHLLAVHYPDVRAHYLELSGNEPWQQQLQIDLQYLTGAMTFPYIFVCGQYIGGSTELFELHESGQLRRLVSQCLQKTAPK